MKKPFDLIVAPDAKWAKAMSGLRWWHRAAVVPAHDEKELLTQWQRASRFPS
jgi:hypothetical protein